MGNNNRMKKLSLVVFLTLIPPASVILGKSVGGIKQRGKSEIQTSLVAVCT